VRSVRPGPLPLLAAVAVLCSAVAAAVPVAERATHTVTIENMVFTPARLVVHRGDRIMWVNKDLFPHTATAASFDSGSIDVGSSWSYTAATAGDYSYGCKFHPTMKGELKVE
jgi:plastocyanin